MFEMLPLLVPIVALMIPIVAILTTHQRKMAELFAQNRAMQPGSLPQPELDLLRREVAELKDLLRQQAIAMDGRPPLPTDALRDRIS